MMWPAGRVSRMSIGVGFAVFIGGCVNMDTVSNAPLDSGISRSFDATYDHTTATTLKALASLNVNVTSSKEEPDGTVYLVSKPLSAFSWGEVGRVFVQRSSLPPTTVFVNWQKRDQVQITGTSASDFSNALFTDIAKAL